MVHSPAQSPDEPQARMSPQPHLKRKKLDDDELSVSKRARNRVRFVLTSVGADQFFSYLGFNLATPAGSAIVESKKYVPILNHW